MQSVNFIIAPTQYVVVRYENTTRMKLKFVRNMVKLIYAVIQFVSFAWDGSFYEN